MCSIYDKVAVAGENYENAKKADPHSLIKQSQSAKWDEREDDNPYFSHIKQNKRAKRYQREIKRYFRAVEQQFKRRYKEVSGGTIFLFFRATEQEQFNDDQWRNIVGGLFTADAVYQLMTENFLNEEMFISFDESFDNTVKFHNLVGLAGARFIPSNVVTNYQGFYKKFAEQYAKQLQDQINSIITFGVEDGKTNRQVAKEITTKFERLRTFDSLRVARTETIRGSGRGLLTAYEQLGAMKYNVSTAATACPICVSIATFGPYDIKDTSGRPPFHPSCYSDDTEVLTRNGWKFIKDVEIGEQCLSMDPKTQIGEYVDVVNKVSKFQERMLHFKSHNFDLLVTEDHQMAYISDFMYKNGGEVRLKCAHLLSQSKSNWIPRTVKWIGNECGDYVFGDLKVNAKDLFYFLGWYLSEGSTTKRSENHYQIKISQEKGNLIEDVEKSVKGLGLKYYSSDGYIGFNHKEFGEFLYSFGKSFEKYVPNAIKEASPELIATFLDSYIKGDGSTRITNCFGFSSKEITISTSSKRMADDLCELILKIGKRPSIAIQEKAGKVTAHKNGEYASNYDQYCVRVCNSKYTLVKNCDVAEVEYNKMVYCVELEKYHLLYVRRNGKCTWCGNCRCYNTPVF